MSGPEDNATAQEQVNEVETASSSQGSNGAASSSGHRSESEAGPAVGKSCLLDQIQALRHQQQALKDQKKQLAKDMKNAVTRKRGCKSVPASSPTHTSSRF